MRTTKWLAAVLVAGCVVVWDDARLTIRNESTSPITEVRLGGNWGGWWGPNLIDETLMPGDDFVTQRIACGTYDLQVTDAAGHRCVVSRFYVCDRDRELSISTGMMSGCGP